jgi:hypothetical protein
MLRFRIRRQPLGFDRIGRVNDNKRLGTVDARHCGHYRELKSPMTWKYQPVLNACIQIMLTTLFGAIMAACKVFDNAFVRQAVQFVFYVALPCLVVSGLGIWIDFSSDLFIWNFILAYLELRGIALGSAIIVVLILNRKELSWEVLEHITVSFQ